MGLFDWFRSRRPSLDEELAEAVCRDATKAFASLAAARPGERVYGLALCIDNGAQSFYIMGNTLEGCLEKENRGRAKPFELAQLTPGDFLYSPADWIFAANIREDTSSPVMERIWKTSNGVTEGTELRIHRAIVAGLKKFDASGVFRGGLPRDRMVLTLWENDPDHPQWVIQWAKELNPPQAFEWFCEGYPYEVENDAAVEDDASIEDEGTNDEKESDDEVSEDGEEVSEIERRVKGLPVDRQIEYWLEQIDCKCRGEACELSEAGYAVILATSRLVEIGEPAVTPLLQLACRHADKPEWRRTGPDKEDCELTGVHDPMIKMIWAVRDIGYADAEVERRLRELLANACRINEPETLWGLVPFHCAKCLKTLFNRYPKPEMTDNKLENYEEFLRVPLP